jgi:hypothetical protein
LEAQKASSFGDAVVAAVAVEAPGLAADAGDAVVAAADGGGPDVATGFVHANARTTKETKETGIVAFIRGAPN